MILFLLALLLLLLVVVVVVAAAAAAVVVIVFFYRFLVCSRFFPTKFSFGVSFRNLLLSAFNHLF
jgi:hypothetical protein